MPIELLCTSILAYFLFLGADILTRKYSIQKDSLVFIWNRALITSLLASIWLIASGEFRNIPDLDILFKLIGSSLIVSLGIIGFVEANKHISLSNLISIHLVGIVLQQFAAVFLLHEPATMLLITSGIISLAGLGFHASIPRNVIGLFWAIVSSFGWTVGYTVLSIPLKESNAIWGNLIVELTILLVSIVMLVSKNQKFEILFTQKEFKKPLVIIGVITSLGAILVNYNYQKFLVSHIAMLGIWLYPITIILSRNIFGEKLTIKEWMGNLLILLGAILFLVFN